MKYKYWEVLEELPEGYVIDKATGSPLCGYDFATNGKSPINGQKRILVKSKKSISKEIETTLEPTKGIVNKKQKIEWTYDKNSVKAVNELARKTCEKRILNDIMVDLMICEIEGWGKTEYINELKRLIGSLISKNKSETKSIKQENLLWS